MRLLLKYSPSMSPSMGLMTAVHFLADPKVRAAAAAAAAIANHYTALCICPTDKAVHDWLLVDTPERL